jgi:hypothetical protein
LDSLLSEAYDDSSYDLVDALHHTDGENRAMASAFSYYVPFLHYSSDPHDQLTQSSRASHGFNSPFYHPNSRLTVEPIRLLKSMIVQSHIRHPSYPFMGTAAHNADVPMGKPRRFL